MVVADKVEPKDGDFKNALGAIGVVDASKTDAIDHEAIPKWRYRWTVNTPDGGSH